MRIWHVRMGDRGRDCSQRSRCPFMRSRMPHARAISPPPARTATAPTARAQGAVPVARRAVEGRHRAARCRTSSDGKRPATIMHQLAKGYTRRADRRWSPAWFAAAETLTTHCMEPAMTMQRREFLKAAARSPARRARFAGCATMGGGPRSARWSSSAAATAAPRRRSTSACGATGAIDVTLVEPNPAFISCPMSNLVLGGSRTLADLTVPYDRLARNHGVQRRARHRDRGRRRQADRAARERQRAAVRPAGALAGHRLHVRQRARRSTTRDAQERDPARVEGRTADGRAAPAARGDAGRRRLRDLRSRSRPIAARRDPTSARARSRGTSSARSRSSKVLILDGNGGRDVEGRRCSRRRGPRSTRASSSTGRTTC